MNRFFEFANSNCLATASVIVFDTDEDAISICGVSRALKKYFTSTLNLLQENPSCPPRCIFPHLILCIRIHWSNFFVDVSHDRSLGVSFLSRSAHTRRSRRALLIHLLPPLPSVFSLHLPRAQHLTSTLESAVACGLCLCGFSFSFFFSFSVLFWGGGSLRSLLGGP